MSKKFYIYRNCFSGDVSGGDTHMSGILKWAIANKTQWNIFLIHPNNDNQQEYYSEVGSQFITNIVYKPLKSSGNFATTFLLRALRASLIRIPRCNQSVYIASSHFMPDVLPVFVRQFLDKKCTSVVYIHHIVRDMPRVKNVNNWLANIQERICLTLIKHKFKKIIVVSPIVKSRLIELGFKSEKIFVSTNFVDISKNIVRKYSQKDIDIIFCGRFVKQKGVYDFLKIVAALQSTSQIKKAVMIGEGPERKGVADIIHKQQLPIDLKGYVSDLEKYDLISRSKIFLFPSYEEGWGIVVAEALTCGTKVIAYDLPAYKDIFGSQINTAPTGDLKALTELMRKRLLPQDEDSYDEWVKSTRHLVKAYDVKDVSKKEYDFMLEDG